MKKDILKLIFETRYLLLIIVAVGALVRLWNYSSMPFTYDEMSALKRTGFSSFSDLIHQGVKIDAHPPLIQVFLNYWVAIFGKVEWVVKLPFVLMGIASVVLTFSIGKKWFNETVGLISASFLAVLQFSTMYSIIARPYVSGMFFLLIMVYFWSKIIQNPKENYWKNWTLTLVFASLCAYNHHFSLLAAVIIGITGLFLVHKKEIFKYVLLLPAGFLLFLPNLSIFMYQLNIGGVGTWLGPPTPMFLLDFIQYVFHFSWWIFLVLVIVIVIGVKFFKKSDFKFQKWALAGIWFFSVFLIGYFYSLYVNPVLQFSMLLFLFPFLLFFIFGWISKLEGKWNGGVVLLILAVGTTSLSLERNHFQVFEQNRYFQMKADAMEFGVENTEIILLNFKDIIEHPFPENFENHKDIFTWEYHIDELHHIEEKIAFSNKNQLMIGYLEQMPKEILSIAQAYFPNVVAQRCYNGATTYLFSKEQKTTDLSLIYFRNSFKENTIEKYMNFDESKMKDGVYVDSTEWSLGFELMLSDKVQHPYDILMLKAKIKPSKPNKSIVLVADIRIKDASEGLFWAASDSKSFITDSEGNMIIHLSIDFNTFSRHIQEDLQLNAYLWDQNKQVVVIEDLSFEIQKGNRNKYMLYERINKLD